MKSFLKGSGKTRAGFRSELAKNTKKAGVRWFKVQRSPKDFPYWKAALAAIVEL
jgi:hypothetical protein